MKITFTRVLNSALPEPYKGLDTDILYLSDKGYVYPEGSDKPIDMFDPSLIKYLSDNPKTTINKDEQIKLPIDFDSDSFMSALEANKSVLEYIITVRYASVKGCGKQLNMTRAEAKEKLEFLEKLNMLGRYGSFYIIKDDIKELLAFELRQEK